MGCHFPSPGDLPDPGTEPSSPAWQVDPIVIVKILAPVFKRQLEVETGVGVTNLNAPAVLLCPSGSKRVLLFLLPFYPLLPLLLAQLL